MGRPWFDTLSSPKNERLLGVNGSSLSFQQRFLGKERVPNQKNCCVGGYGWRSITNMGSEVKLIKPESSILSKHSGKIKHRSFIDYCNYNLKTCHGVFLGVAV